MAEIVFSIRNQLNGKNYPIAQGQRFETLPDKCTVEVSFKGVAGAEKIRRVAITLDEQTTIERDAPYRLGGDNGVTAIFEGEHLIAVTAWNHSTAGEPIFNVKRRFTVGKEVKPTPKPPDGIVWSLRTHGVCCYLSDSIPKSMAVLSQMKRDAIRVWTTSFDSGVDSSAASQAKAWKASGIREILVCATPAVNASTIPTLNAVREWAKKFRDVFAGAIDAVQVVNECNLTIGSKTVYWAGSIQQAADAFNAVQSVLSGSGIGVIAPSISENVQKFEVLVKTGIKPDAWDFHAYGANAEEHIDRVKAVAALCGSTPLIESEFNIHAGSFSGWRVELPKAFEGVKPFVNALYDYRLILNTQPAGKFGMVDKTWKPNPQTYQTWASL